MMVEAKGQSFGYNRFESCVKVGEVLFECVSQADGATQEEIVKAFDEKNVTAQDLIAAFRLGGLSGYLDFARQNDFLKEDPITHRYKFAHQKVEQST